MQFSKISLRRTCDRKPPDVRRLFTQARLATPMHTSENNDVSCVCVFFIRYGELRWTSNDHTANDLRVGVSNK